MATPGTSSPTSYAFNGAHPNSKAQHTIDQLLQITLYLHPRTKNKIIMISIIPRKLHNNVINNAVNSHHMPLIMGYHANYGLTSTPRALTSSCYIHLSTTN